MERPPTHKFPGRATVRNSPQSTALTLPGHPMCSLLASFITLVTKMPECLVTAPLWQCPAASFLRAKLSRSTHLGPCQPLVPEVVIIAHPKFPALAPAVVAKHLGVGFEDVVYGVQAVHMADLLPVLQGGPFWVEQVLVRIHNQEQLFLERCEGAT